MGGGLGKKSHDDSIEITQEQEAAAVVWTNFERHATTLPAAASAPPYTLIPSDGAEGHIKAAAGAACVCLCYVCVHV